LQEARAIVAPPPLPQGETPGHDRDESSDLSPPGTRPRASQSRQSFQTIPVSCQLAPQLQENRRLASRTWSFQAILSIGLTSRFHLLFSTVGYGVVERRPFGRYRTAQSHPQQEGG